MQGYKVAIKGVEMVFEKVNWADFPNHDSMIVYELSSVYGLYGKLRGLDTVLRIMYATDNNIDVGGVTIRLDMVRMLEKNDGSFIPVSRTKFLLLTNNDFRAFLDYCDWCKEIGVPSKKIDWRKAGF